MVSMCCSILVGRLIDYVVGTDGDHRRGYFALYGTGVTVFIFAMFAQQGTSFPPLILMVLLGSSYCICASTLWPWIQVLVAPETAGTANGIATSMQMLGIGICNLLVGIIKDHDGYPAVMWFFTCMGALSFLFALWLNNDNFKRWLGTEADPAPPESEAYERMGQDP